jgi:MFS transporter, UMF1 family
MTAQAPASRKEIFGWAMFDFANQAYTLLIITVVFGDLFARVIVGDRGDGYAYGNLLWSIALSVSYLLVVASAPVLGAIMDYTAAKKRFLFKSYVVTIIATTLLYLVEPGLAWLGVILIIVSNYAYSVGESFIASFLPDLGPPEKLGWISGYGWALGYVGGLAAAGFTLVFLGEVSAENFERIRWVGPFSAFFFLVAAIPTFLWLKERGRRHELPAGESLVHLGFARLKATWDRLHESRDMATLLASVFFAMAGVYIVIAFAFIYGAQVIGWDPSVRNIMFIVVQVTAAAGALAFGFLQDRIGARTVYIITLLLWIVAIGAIYATPVVTVAVNDAFGTEWQAQHVFLAAGLLAGLSLGSSQSAGRALVGVLSPRAKAAEFFGFWGLSSKLAAVFGILGLGVLQTIFGLHRSILFCVALFRIRLSTVKAGHILAKFLLY